MEKNLDVMAVYHNVLVVDDDSNLLNNSKKYFHYINSMNSH